MTGLKLICWIKTSRLPMLSQSQRRTLPIMVYQIHFVRQWTTAHLSGIFWFCQDLWFQVNYRIAYYARATGKDEAAVKEAKKMIKRSDLLTGLLDHRNKKHSASGYGLLPSTNVSLPANKVYLAYSWIIVEPICSTRNCRPWRASG